METCRHTKNVNSKLKIRRPPAHHVDERFLGHEGVLHNIVDNRHGAGVLVGPVLWGGHHPEAVHGGEPLGVGGQMVSRGGFGGGVTSPIGDSVAISGGLGGTVVSTSLMKWGWKRNKSKPNNK